MTAKSPKLKFKNQKNLPLMNTDGDRVIWRSGNLVIARDPVIGKPETFPPRPPFLRVSKVLGSDHPITRDHQITRSPSLDRRLLEIRVSGFE